jgi:hypothetical protein
MISRKRIIVENYSASILHEKCRAYGAGISTTNLLDYYSSKVNS